ncbi:hypothetical protein [Brumimicrobium aurantiacum]|uniref:Uncharacterized protein n=1 Tax=Brumimicrobium aurantiacum TaxID=1737063 RepID=A0A3E1F0F1_9FLAO|nr:hypothetical protein [Brumimicrobium aurantiacum]RFC55291.1 hypothetical protein DXU93_05575 [Brumimicrobium aurantiacum]
MTKYCAIKYQKSRKQFPYLLLILFGFISCEKETQLDFFIENQSLSTINIEGTNIISSTDIDQTINQKVQKNVATWSKRGKQTDYFEPTAIFGNNLIITNATGDTLIKDYKLLSNWNASVDDQRTIASHEYVLVISDTDF